MQRIEKEFSQEWEIYRIVMSDVKGLPTYLELESQCSAGTIYNIIEMLDVRDEINDINKPKEPPGQK